jgi:hypothetical protein
MGRAFAGALSSLVGNVVCDNSEAVAIEQPSDKLGMDALHPIIVVHPMGHDRDRRSILR